jgi:FkbM family methyltransferase
MDAKRLTRGIARRLGDRLRPPPGEVPKSVLAQYVRADAVVVEAGAYRGYDTLEMSRQWPAGTIHAFEPVPNLFDAMRDRTAGCSNVRRYNAALGRVSGTAEMWVSGGQNDQSSSLRVPKTHLEELPEVTFEDKISVPVLALDDWAEERGIHRVDLIWLDLQGNELDALRGGERLLRSASAIYTEVIATEQYEGAALYPELRSWLEDRGFEARIEKLPWGGGNVLFVRRP